MTITSTEIRSMGFRVTVRGYAIDEVDAFLDRIEAELAPAPDQAALTLRLAEQTATRLIEEARAHAAQLKAEAAAEADELIVSAKATLATIKDSAARRLEREYRERMRALLEEQLRTLDT